MNERIEIITKLPYNIIEGLIFLVKIIFLVVSLFMFVTLFWVPNTELDSQLKAKLEEKSDTTFTISDFQIGILNAEYQVAISEISANLNRINNWYYSKYIIIGSFLAALFSFIYQRPKEPEERDSKQSIIKFLSKPTAYLIVGIAFILCLTIDIQIKDNSIGSQERAAWIKYYFEKPLISSCYKDSTAIISYVNEDYRIKGWECFFRSGSLIENNDNNDFSNDFLFYWKNDTFFCGRNKRFYKDDSLILCLSNTLSENSFVLKNGKLFYKADINKMINDSLYNIINQCCLNTGSTKEKISYIKRHLWGYKDSNTIDYFFTKLSPRYFLTYLLYLFFLIINILNEQRSRKWLLGSFIFTTFVTTHLAIIISGYLLHTIPENLEFTKPFLYTCYPDFNNMEITRFSFTILALLILVWNLFCLVLLNFLEILKTKTKKMLFKFEIDTSKFRIKF